jgi:hypothetical protein
MVVEMGEKLPKRLFEVSYEIFDAKMFWFIVSFHAAIVLPKSA